MDLMSTVYGSQWMPLLIILKKQSRQPVLQKALKAIECFDQHERRPEKYGVAAAFYGEDCMNEVLELLQSITEGKKEVDYDDPETDLNMIINAIVANNAE